MTRIVFSDFDEFADSIRGIAGRFIPTARSQADWWVDVSSLGRVDLQELQIGGAATYAGDGTPNTLTIGVPMTDPKKIRIDAFKKRCCWSSRSFRRWVAFGRPCCGFWNTTSSCR